MSNLQKIEKKLKNTGFVVGGITDKIELLNASNLKKVMDDMIDNGSCDVDININRKPFVAEISHVDNEIDIGIISKAEYIDRYGNERYEDEDED